MEEIWQLKNTTLLGQIVLCKLENETFEPKNHKAKMLNINLDKTGKLDQAWILD